MMTDYDSMSNEQLDKAAADIFKILPYKWHPTDPESNDCELYLFPKILEKSENIDVNLHYWAKEWFVTITMNRSLGHWRVEECAKDPDQINRTKVICCLKAMEKINES